MDVDRHHVADVPPVARSVHGHHRVVKHLVKDQDIGHTFRYDHTDLVGPGHPHYPCLGGPGWPWPGGEGGVDQDTLHRELRPRQVLHLHSRGTVRYCLVSLRYSTLVAVLISYRAAEPS